MRKQIIAIFSLVAFTLIFFCACRHDPLTPLSEAPTISFANDVEPIIISNCAQSGCHGGNGNHLQLLSYTDIQGQVSQGKPHNSSLYQAITANTINTMPKSPNPRLTNLQIKTIYLWIIQGAKNN